MDEHKAHWNHCVQHASLTDVGLRRANNQDSLAVVLAGSEEKWRRHGHLFMVADGMGAHAAGELASKLATDTVPLAYYKLTDRPPAEAVLAAVKDANAQINSRGQASEDFRGMGTTVSVLVLLPDAAMTAHVGDSRAYRWRANRLEQLTFDHSLVWELRDARQIRETDVPLFIPKNVITRSLGPNPEVQVDLEGPFPLQRGDVFLLCSDGLSGPVRDEEIGQILGSLPPDEAVRALVDLANLRGGPDNVTAVVVRVAASEAVQSLPPKGAGNKDKSAPKLVHPVIWALLGVFALGAAGLATLQQWILTAGCLIATAVAGITALVWRYRPDSPIPQHNGPPLGQGPYTACDCLPGPDFVDRLVELTKQLRDAAVSEAWQIDWDRFNALFDRAVAAMSVGSHPDAVRHYCHAISFMMDQLRAQRGRRSAGDSDPADLPQ
ncbi:MAG: PP2C family protein-serine/threonine phosphatase [Planctomycetota bacterium]|jgi:protein phosphatase